MIDAVTALSATKSAAPSYGAGAAGAANEPAGDFGQVLSQVVNDAIGTVQNGEAVAIQGLQGAAPAFKVVEGVMAAQRTLQEALAIRDKAVSAFQDITRMAI